MANQYKQKQIPVLVLDPDKRSLWNADFITNDPEEFLLVVFANRSCAIFVDESGDMIGRYGGAMNRLATTSRKWGHNCHFIAQRAKQIDVTTRTQCSNIFLFKQSLDDTKELARDFCAEDLKQAHTLKKGEYLMKIGVDGIVKKCRAW